MPNMSLSFKNKKTLFLLDQDGTIYNGNTLFKETIPFLNSVLKSGARYAFVTNNSSKSIKDYILKLANFNINVTQEDFFTATDATIYFLKQNYPGARIFVVGTKSFKQALRANNIKISSSKHAEIALLAYDSELTYKKLTEMCELLLTKDVPYFATNPDLVCPIEFGAVPDCGSFAIMIENATKRKPIYIGKPNKTFLDLALQKYSTNKDNAVMIGDRLYTDIQSAINSEIDSVLTLTGEATLTDVQEYPHKPTFIVKNLSEII